MPPKPVVYCETNWLVALAFPHHQHHRLARELREQGRRGECEIRLPYAAVLEAPHPIGEESKRIGNAFAVLRDELANAAQNGMLDFTVVAEALRSDAMSRYLARPAPRIVEELVADPSIIKLRGQEVALGRLDEVRSKLTFRGKDAVDLYIIASVVGDRLALADPERPAVFFSADRKAFEPKVETQAKMQEQFYEPYRIVWRGDFDLEPAVRHWQNELAVKPTIEA